MARRRKGNRVDGWLYLDKPAGIGSTSAVSRVRRLLNARKAGHAGTLDPLASGVLAIALGEATKTVPYLVDARKVYRFTVRWGIGTSTDDGEGEQTGTHSHRPAAASIRRILPKLTGTIDQVPPAFSAIKLSGRRAYDLAREGAEVALPVRQVEIGRFSLLACPDEDHAEFEVECGKGTYVRALARDMARMLGTLGHVTRLRRIAVGPVGLADTVTLDDLVDARITPDPHACLRPLDDVLGHLAHCELDADMARHILHGRPISADRCDIRAGEAEEILLRRCGSPLAIARMAAGRVHPVRVFDMQGQH